MSTMNLNKMEKTNIVEEVRKFVEEECKKPDAHYGIGCYLYHFVSMHSYAKMLAEKLNADLETVELAAWLHDIGSIIHGREKHHITGAEIAEKKLRELNYPEEKIKLIKECILCHRGSVNVEKKSKEAQIIADADAMSAFDNIGGIFNAAFIFEKKDQKVGTKAVKEKLINSWNKISPIAKEFVKEKYEAAMKLFGADY